MGFTMATDVQWTAVGTPTEVPKPSGPSAALEADDARAPWTMELPWENHRSPGSSMIFPWDFYGDE